MGVIMGFGLDSRDSGSPGQLLLWLLCLAHSLSAGLPLCALRHTGPGCRGESMVSILH